MKEWLTRDHLIWTFTFWGSIVTFIIGHTSLVPQSWHTPATDIAAILGFISGYLQTSPLKISNQGYAKEITAHFPLDEKQDLQRRVQEILASRRYTRP